MTKKYRIIKSRRQVGDVFYLVQKRFLFLFWITFSESIPVGFADFMDFEVRYESYEKAENAIHKDFANSRQNKAEKIVVYPDIEEI